MINPQALFDDLAVIIGTLIQGPLTLVALSFNFWFTEVDVIDGSTLTAAATSFDAFDDKVIGNL
jgi:hypothetical protein